MSALTRACGGCCLKGGQARSNSSGSRCLQKHINYRNTSYVGELRVAGLNLFSVLGGSTNCDLVLLWEPDVSGDELHCRLHWSSPQLNAPDLIDYFKQLVLWPAEGLPGRVWASNRYEILSELAQDGHCGRSFRLAKAGIRSAAAFPLLDQTAVKGVIELFGRRPGLLVQGLSAPMATDSVTAAP